MFNDILTGKASLEAPVPPPAPTAGPPAQGPDFARNAAASARAVAESARDLDVRSNSHKLLAGAGLLMVAVAWFGFKYAMRQQLREDRAAAYGYEYSVGYSYDEYANAVSSYASSMCACDDRKCAREVQWQFERWQRTTPLRPESDSAEESARGDAERMAECLTKLDQ